MTDGVIDYGSGNVFADLGFPQPEEHLAKAELTQQILKIIKQRGMNQTAAAELLGIDQPKVSALMRGRLRGFSLDRLFRFLNLLDKDVDIVVKDKAKGRERGQTNLLCNYLGR